MSSTLSRHVQTDSVRRQTLSHGVSAPPCPGGRAGPDPLCIQREGLHHKGLLHGFYWTCLYSVAPPPCERVSEGVHCVTVQPHVAPTLYQRLFTSYIFKRTCSCWVHDEEWPSQHHTPSHLFPPEGHEHRLPPGGRQTETNQYTVSQSDSHRAGFITPPCCSWLRRSDVRGSRRETWFPLRLHLRSGIDTCEIIQHVNNVSNWIIAGRIIAGRIGREINEQGGVWAACVWVMMTWGSVSRLQTQACRSLLFLMCTILKLLFHRINFTENMFYLIQVRYIWLYFSLCFYS